MLPRILAAALSAAPSSPLVTSFEWSAPAECIGERELESMVTLRLGRAAFVARGEADLHLAGAVTLEPSGRYRARFALESSSGVPLGTREVVSDEGDCRSLEEAAAVVMAVMLNVRRADLEPPPQLDEPPAEPEALPAWEAQVAAGGGATFGLMPGPSAHASLTGSVSKRSLVLELELMFAPAPPKSIDVGVVKARALGGRLGAGLKLPTSRLELSARVTLGGGALFVSGSGFDVDSSAIGPWLEVGGGVRAAVRLAWGLWFSLHGDCAFVPYARAFGVREPDGTATVLYKPSISLGSVGAQLGVRWPVGSGP